MCPNANLMIIDNAERLGLSQLHQLRGRVGRGNKESNCILLYKSPLSITAKKRLTLMRQMKDGFLLATEDLKIRGSGSIFGKNQTGKIEFKVAKISQYENTFDEITLIAEKLIEHYPNKVTLIINRLANKI